MENKKLKKTKKLNPISVSLSCVRIGYRMSASAIWNLFVEFSFPFIFSRGVSRVKYERKRERKNKFILHEHLCDNWFITSNANKNAMNLFPNIITSNDKLQTLNSTADLKLTKACSFPVTVFKKRVTNKLIMWNNCESVFTNNK